ncbi:MAG: TonB-dependent receptor [Campylobacter sp.]|nr:TonB-dependent receptor [Campylobacter sp.]
MKKTNLALSACMVLVSVALANDSENSRIHELETITVTAQTNGSEARIDNDKINVRNASLIRDILRDVPGVSVGGTHPVHQKIFMRGISERGINVTIDGARQRGSLFHHSGELFVDTDILKSVDVGFNANSVVANSGSLAGSVAFKTVDAKDLLGDESFGGKIKGGYASNNKEWQESLTLYGKPLENIDILGYVNHRGYKQGKDGEGEKIGGDGDTLNYMLKMGADFNDYSRLTLSGERLKIDGDFWRMPERSRGNNQTLTPTKVVRDTYTAIFNTNPNDFVDLEANAYYTQREFQSEAQSASNRQPVVKTLGAKVINKTRIGDTNGLNQTFVYGGEYFQSQGFNRLERIIPKDEAKSLSIFLEDQIRYGGLTVTPGIRFDNYKLETMGGGIGVIERQKYSWNEFSPGLSADYSFDNGFGAYASWAKVFRGPEIYESRYVATAHANGDNENDDLKPETGNDYEAGIRYKGQILDNQSVSFTAKYFYGDYDNLVTAVEHSATQTFKRVNVGSAAVKGFEISARYNIENLNLSASYSRSRTNYKNIPDTTSLGNSALAYSDSGDKYTFNAEYFIAPIDLLVGYNLIAFNKINTKNNRNVEFKKPGYAVSDIYLTWLPSKIDGFELNFGIYNIFDKAYWAHDQRNGGQVGGTSSDWEPGRNIKASVSYKF